MKRRAAALGLSVLVVLGAGSPASAEPTERGHWAFDEIDSPVAFDSSGLGNHGRNVMVTGDGQGYAFNGTDSRVVVPDAASLDPELADFSYGVTMVMTTPPAVGQTYDVLRKGLTTTPGGSYKLEIFRSNGGGRARCVVKDAQKVVASIQGTTNLADGASHDVTCSRVGNSVVLRVDALAPRTKRVASLGSVSNALDLGLGAKAEGTAKTGFDWYLGTLLDARISIG